MSLCRVFHLAKAILQCSLSAESLVLYGKVSPNILSTARFEIITSQYNIKNIIIYLPLISMSIQLIKAQINLVVYLDHISVLHYYHNVEYWANHSSIFKSI